LKEYKDPAQEKLNDKRKALLNASNTFKAIALEWMENRKDSWTKGYTAHVESRLEADIFPAIGDCLIKDVTAPEVLAAIRKIEKRGARDLPHRMLQISGAVFRYAIATGRGTQDPTQALRGALKTTKKVHHAFLTAQDMPEFMEKLLAYDGDKITKLALRLIVLTFLRTGELRAGEWKEIDFEKAEWRVPADRMKMRETHIVPLSRQALNILHELKQMSGKNPHVFPSRHQAFKCMSNNTMLFALYRMGYHSKATVHGFRSTASTMLNEMGYRSDVIERQLSHSERNKIRAAYNHAQYLPERRKMMQEWADHLDTISGNNVIVGNFDKAAE